MPAYLVRLIKSRDLVGFFAADDLDDLVVEVDECTDVEACEYVELPPGGIMWTGPAVGVPLDVADVEDENSEAKELPWALATRVYSTPPTNTPVDLTRRRLITIAAGGAVAAAISTAALMAAHAVDPIYAAIERHKQAAAVWDAAVDVRSNFHDLHMTAEQWEQCDELAGTVRGHPNEAPPPVPQEA